MKKLINAIHKFAKICYIILSWLAVASIVSMLVIMSIEVVRRYIFSKTFIWSDEIIRMLLLYCAYLGGAAAYYKHNLTSFNMVTNKLNKRANDILKLVCNIILSAFFVFLLFYTYKKMTSPSVVKSVSTATGLTGAFPYYGIFIGTVFLSIFTVDFYPELIATVVDDFKKKEAV